MQKAGWIGDKMEGKPWTGEGCFAGSPSAWRCKPVVELSLAPRSPHWRDPAVSAPSHCRAALRHC